MPLAKLKKAKNQKLKRTIRRKGARERGKRALVLFHTSVIAKLPSGSRSIPGILPKMRAEYERISLSRRAVCGCGEVDYEYEGGYTYDEFIEQLEQRVQISRGRHCYDISWHEPTQRVFVYELDAEGYSDEYFLTSPALDRLTLRNVLEALGLPADRAKLDWSEEEGTNLENLLDAPVESAPLNQLSICNQ